MKPQNALREASIYNNIMYALAGRVAEEIGGKTWEELVEEEILTPLAMNSTTFYHLRQKGLQYAKQYHNEQYSIKELNFTAF